MILAAPLILDPWVDIQVRYVMDRLRPFMVQTIANDLFYTSPFWAWIASQRHH